MPVAYKTSSMALSRRPSGVETSGCLQERVNFIGTEISGQILFELRRIDIHRRIGPSAILLPQEPEKIAERNQVTSHALRTQTPTVKGCKKSTNVISAGIGKAPSTVLKELAKMHQVPPVIRDAVGRESFFNSRVIKVIVDFRKSWGRTDARLQGRRGFLSRYIACRLGGTSICRR